MAIQKIKLDLGTVYQKEEKVESIISAIRSTEHARQSALKPVTRKKQTNRFHF